eukprot:SAG31_NODE_976_length_10618_cov_3.277118_2_plen_412_part_00
MALEKAIKQIESNDNGKAPHWNAHIRYGDTDSLFVEFPGRSRADAWILGREIADRVTRVNRRPIELELEKVYHPCLLLTKKRYVGYSYEKPTQEEPIFDAKGIETVRRDSCPVVAKMLEKCIRILFEDKDLSKAKRYCQRQWSKILLNRVPVEDMIFKKEVKLGSYRNETTIPPAAVVASKAMAIDPMAEPRYGERVAYVVVYGQPGARLIDTVVSPHEFILGTTASGANAATELRLNANYYITKQIVPALARIFQIVGTDVASWWEDMPRQLRHPLMSFQAASGGTGGMQASGGLRTVDHYFRTRTCLLCFNSHRNTSGWYCSKCATDPAQLLYITTNRQREAMVQRAKLLAVCRSCCTYLFTQQEQHESTVGRCDSLDCPVFFLKTKANRAAAAHSAIGVDTFPGGFAW